MTTVAVAEAVLIAVLLVLLAVALRTLGQVTRQHARKEDLMLNQILHATGNTWQPPPADTRDRYEIPEPVETLYASPEQMTEDDLEPEFV